MGMSEISGVVGYLRGRRQGPQSVPYVALTCAVSKQWMRVLVEAFEDNGPFDLHVEPWGATFPVASGEPVVVTFLSGFGLPASGITRGSDYMSVCAEGGNRTTASRTGLGLSAQPGKCRSGAPTHAGARRCGYDVG